MITVTIDGQKFQTEQDKTVLHLAREHGIRIPSVCHHPALKPSGSCRLCGVEVTGKSGRLTVVQSCALKVKDGLEVHTQSERVIKARTKAFEKLLQMAPQAVSIRRLAAEYGVDPGPPPDGCIRCRLCLNVCKDIVGAGALRMEKRDGWNFVVSTAGLCIGCGTCANVCPTQAIQVEDNEGVRTISIRNEVIGRHLLERCEACGKLYATHKFLAHVAERTTSHPDVKEHHRYCGTCAKLFSDRVRSSARIRRL